MDRSIPAIALLWVGVAVGIVVAGGAAAAPPAKDQGIGRPQMIIRPIVPCDGCTGAAFGINDAGELAGLAMDAAGNHGFVGRPGAFALFDVPGALFTEGVSINNAGDVGGDYLTPSGLGVFLRKPDGTLRTPAPLPTAASISGLALNNSGLMTGNYADDPIGATGARGFILRGSRLIAPVSYPGAFVTQLLGSNDRGVIVGYQLADPTAPPQAFIRHRDGRLEDYRIPGALSTMLYDINNSGHMVGGYVDGAGHMHGFLATAETVVTIDHSGPNTLVFGLNDRDEVVGASYPENGFFTGPYDGFVARVRIRR